MRTLEELLTEHTQALKANTEAIMLLVNQGKASAPKSFKPIMFTQARAAKYLGFSDQKLMRLRKDGTIPCHPEGHRIVFYLHELQDYAYTHGIETN